MFKLKCMMQVGEAEDGKSEFMDESDNEVTKRIMTNTRGYRKVEGN